MNRNYGLEEAVAVSGGEATPVCVLFDLLRVQRFCINDGPGIRSTVFFMGCPLQCAWCHNPESIAPGTKLMYNARLCTGCGLCAKRCPMGVHSFEEGRHHVDFRHCTACGECLKVCVAEALTLHGRQATVGEVMDEILKDADYYEESGGGVTLSGGEPLLQPEAAVALAQACHEQGITVYLDTSGFAETNVFWSVSNEMDGFLYDIKIVDPLLHREYTGVDNSLILSNFETAVQTQKPLRMRVIVIPGLTDTRENLDGLVALAQCAGFHGPVDLMPYHRMGAGKHYNMGLEYAMEGVAPPSRERLEEIQSFFKQNGLTATIQ